VSPEGSTGFCPLIREKKELRRGLNLNLAPIRLFLKKPSRRGSALRKRTKG
jgi:hypothetical protein